jgi:hypothetical protein
MDTKMKTQRSLVCSILLTAAIAFGGSVEESSQGCRYVEGAISAQILPDGFFAGTALGTVTGGLRGATTAQFTADPQPDGSIVLALHHAFVNEAGDSLQTEDAGLLVPVPNSPGVFRMTVQYTITGGTGRFADATGTLDNHGEAILAGPLNGQLTLRYSGQICVDR